MIELTLSIWDCDIKCSVHVHSFATWKIEYSYRASYYWWLSSFFSIIKQKTSKEVGLILLIQFILAKSVNVQCSKEILKGQGKIKLKPVCITFNDFWLILIRKGMWNFIAWHFQYGKYEKYAFYGTMNL